MVHKYFNYCPVLKTSSAELKGYENLDPAVKKGILPLFELTKSRISKSNPNGDIYKQVDKIKELLDGRPFILDLSTETTLINQQIEQMLTNTKDGYSAWTDFLAKAEFKSVIPMIHWNANADVKDNINQINRLKSHYKYLAFRADAYDACTIEYYKTIIDNLPSQQLILILDAGFIHVDKIDAHYNEIKKTLDDIIKCKLPNSVLISSSGFPKTVTLVGYGGDLKGEFKLSEVIINDKLAENYNDVNFIYCDYSGIHPQRYQTLSRGWIARIDYPLDNKYYYYRERGKDYASTYKVVAQRVIADNKYNPIPKFIKSWGDNEIIIAATIAPQGKSPSYWIAVRVNIHISRQYLRNVI